MTRKLFQIGFNKCGTTFIADLLQMNGIPARHWEKGALAEDIAYSKIAGRAPLAPWADDTVAFTDMESARNLNLPIIEAFKDFAFLDQHFPGAIFLLNTRRVDDWVNSRYMHRNGAYARAFAQFLGVGLADLGDIWREDWHRHVTECRAHFAGRPEFVEIDIDEAAPEDYRRALPWFDLSKTPLLPSRGKLRDRSTYAERLARMLALPAPGAGISADQRNRLAGQLADFAKASALPGPSGAPGYQPSQHYACFDAASGSLSDAEGRALPILRDAQGRFIADPRQPGHLLIAATANDIASLTRHGIYEMDLREDCPAGSTADQALDSPIIAGSRRAGAQGVFLWPMPRLHWLTNDAFLGEPLRDDPDFDARSDVAIWRGAPLGYADGGDGPDLARPTARAIEVILSAPTGRPRHDQALADLAANARIRVVQAQMQGDLIDARLQADPRTTRALRKAGLGDLIATGPDPRAARYVICLGGPAAMADLLPALNSNATVLVEEDGWQVFHHALFRPWTHYIPLDWGAGNLAQRLDWARSHTQECQQMSAAARDACAVLADPALRRQHLQGVLAAYRAATAQD